MHQRDQGHRANYQRGVIRRDFNRSTHGATLHEFRFLRSFGPAALNVAPANASPSELVFAVTPGFCAAVLRHVLILTAGSCTLAVSVSGAGGRVAVPARGENPDHPYVQMGLLAFQPVAVGRNSGRRAAETGVFLSTMSTQ
jgi:hypothetical protein